MIRQQPRRPFGHGGIGIWWTSLGRTLINPMNLAVPEEICNMDIETLLKDLRRDEGCSLTAYQDHLGYWTIGFGRLIDKRRGGGISMAEAEMLLENDVERFITQLDHEWPGWRNQPENVQRALANMAFQMGLANLLGFKKMFAALKERDYEKAAEEALDSKWAQQTPHRAQRVAELIRTA